MIYKALLKVDISNAYNTVGRAKILSEDSSSATRSILDYTEVKDIWADTRERKVQKREVDMVRWFCNIQWRITTWKLWWLTRNIVINFQKWWR